MSTASVIHASEQSVSDVLTPSQVQPMPAPTSRHSVWASTVADAVLNDVQVSTRTYLNGQVRITERDALARPSTIRLLDGVCFSSGATNYPDLVALIALDAPVGINAWDASPEVIDRTRQMVADGGRAFFDSGAFHECSSPVDIINFRDVFSRYDRLLDGLDRAATERVTLVMPDRVMHQQRSLERLTEHRDRVRAYVQAGADCLVPIQKPFAPDPERGTLTLGELYARSLDALGLSDGQVRPALPCKRAACDLNDVRSFLRSAAPRGLHLLGRGLASPTNAHWQATIRADAPSIVLTSDACEVTAMLGEGRPLTDKQRALATAMVERVYPADLSYAACLGLLAETPGSVDRRTADRIAARLGLVGEQHAEFVEATQRPTTPAWVDRMEARGWERLGCVDDQCHVGRAEPRHACAAGYLLDLHGDEAWETAQQAVYEVQREQAMAQMARVVRALSAYDALGVSRESRAARSVLLQQDIFGGFSMAG